MRIMHAVRYLSIHFRHVCRMGIELAVLDCLAQLQGEQLLFPGSCNTIAVSGLVSASTVDAAVEQAMQLVQSGYTSLKVKVARK